MLPKGTKILFIDLLSMLDDVCKQGNWL